MPNAAPTFGARLAASIARLTTRAAGPLSRKGANGFHGADAVWASEAPTKKASATGPLIAFEHLRRPVWTPRDYTTFANEGFMQNAIVYRCVRMIAECAGHVPLLLYAGDQEIEAHPLKDLVRRPNAHETWPDFMQRLVGFLLVSGNAYVEAVAIDDQIREIHLLRPDRVKVVPGPDGWPEAFDYTVGGRTVRIGGEVSDGVRSVLHVKLFHPTNDHYGLSPLEAAAQAIDLHNTASKWNKALLDNSARPSGAIVYTARDGNLTGEQIERLKSELEAGFQGSANAGRPLLLEGGLDWKAMSLSPKDMDFIEARHVAAREIALALGVPPMLLGIPGDNTYAADWSEYFGHQPADGSGDVHFHLDPLWASPSIDAVAIDCYWPLADWRDHDHLDRAAGARSIYDVDYLKANLFGGEGYDWFYASDGDRAAQIRTPIVDSAAGKPWVFRYKDVRNWWSSPHYDRPGGVEEAIPTGWVPQSKPMWLTEIGCPAVDKGANQPNVFVDPKSAESFLPYHSSGERDDLMQRRYLQALLEALDPLHPGYVDGANPVSAAYGGRMIAIDHVYVYAWDARPYPAFPNLDLVWSDGANWRLGHWINGRVTGQQLGAVIAALLEGYGFSDYDVSALDGLVSGLVIDRPMSARDAMQPLELAYFLDAIDDGGAIRFAHRGAAPPRVLLTIDDLVETKPGSDLVRLTRAQETDLPAAARVSFSALESDYRQAVAQSRRLVSASGRIADVQLALVMDAGQAVRTADTWLFETWAARERARFLLPPSALALQPGDVVVFEHAGRSRLLRISEVGDHGAREIEAIAIDPSVYTGGSTVVRPKKPRDDDTIGPVLGVFLDLPLLTGAEAAANGYVVAVRDPWPTGGAAFYRSPVDAGFALAAIATRKGITGVLLDDLHPGPEARLDYASRVQVRLDSGVLTSTTRLNLLAGANAAAVEGLDGEWEVIQFETATLVAPATYELESLLRGQAGSERAMRAPIAAGARFVLLDGALMPVPLTSTDIGLPLVWRYGPAARALGDASYQTEVHAFRGQGLRPLSPVHVRGRRDGGDLTITWLRRTRVGGDSWASVEVPLAEDVERYEVDILSAGTVVRTIVASEPTTIYSAAAQTADFGLPQSTVSIRVHQISAVMGRGAPRDAVV